LLLTTKRVNTLNDDKRRARDQLHDLSTKTDRSQLPFNNESNVLTDNWCRGAACIHTTTATYQSHQAFTTQFTPSKQLLLISCRAEGRTFNWLEQKEL